MRPGVQQIAPGLYQSALAHASAWNAVGVVDVAVLMATPVEPLPVGVDHIVAPIDDNADGCDRLDDVRALAKEVAGKRVLSICHMGENRSGLLSTLILIQRGMAPADAVALVQKNGPHNSPTQPHSFWNPGFVRQALAEAPIA